MKNRGEWFRGLGFAENSANSKTPKAPDDESSRTLNAMEIPVGTCANQETVYAVLQG